MSIIKGITIMLRPHCPAHRRFQCLFRHWERRHFELAGQIADGALSWACPVPYLLRTGIPALRASADAVGRASPPLVAHVPVALSDDRRFVLAAGHQMLDFYAHVPFYANMFTNAGLPLTSDHQAVSDDLVESLVVSGNEGNGSCAIYRTSGSRPG